jgi:hypothetical protein
MAVRQPRLAVAAIELGFIVVSLAAGRMIGSWWAYAAVAAGAIAYWVWSRRAALGRMDAVKLIGQGAIAIGFLLVILGAAFWLGLSWREASS